MGTPTAGRRRPRVMATVLAVALAAGAAAAIGYRVLAPAEVLTPARSPYPATVRIPSPGMIGTLSAAPLTVDGRLRVYAAKRQLAADARVDGKERYTPYWSYRRWPAQLTGVVAVRAADRPLVVGRWSDGKLIALDARTGRIAWRAAGPLPDHGYDGRRTGGRTVYQPDGLFTAAHRGQPVLVVRGGGDLRGFDGGSGREMWRHGGHARCAGPALTSTAGLFLEVDTCVSPPVVEIRSVATGASVNRWTPEGTGRGLDLLGLGCAVGRSGCPAVRTTSGDTGRGWLVDDPARGPVPAPPLDAEGAVLVDGTAVTVSGDEVTAVPVRGPADGGAAGSPAPAPTAGGWRWTGPGPVTLLGGQPGWVHLLTADGEFVNLDVRSGTVRSRFPLPRTVDRSGWTPGLAYAADGLLAVERLAEPVDPAAADDRYYAAPEPVLSAAV